MCGVAAAAAVVGGTALQIGGAVGAGQAGKAQAKANQALAKRSAKLKRHSARNVRLGGRQQANIVRDRGAVASGEIESRFAGAGVGIDSDIVQRFTAENRATVENEVTNILFNAQTRAFGLEEEARLDIYLGEAGRHAADISAAGAVLPAVFSGATTWMQARQFAGGSFKPPPAASSDPVPGLSFNSTNPFPNGARLVSGGRF